MPITKTSHYRYDEDTKQTVRDTRETQLYKGRVLEVETVTETRNWSDTMDYTDMRSTTCTYALVWLGTHGIPCEHRYNRDVVWYMEGNIPDYAKDKVRDLEPHEQFGWVDCTNLFSDRNGFGLTPTVDDIDMQMLWGGPEMLDNLQAWKAHLELRRAEDAKAWAARVAEEDARREAHAAKQKAKADKEQAKRDLEAQKFKTAPAKGTTVTLNGLTGKVFWTGVTKYRGKISARVGVKDAKGNVQWGTVEELKA